MPTPMYAMRLPKETQAALSEMAAVYGAPNGRAFAREVLEVMCSGDIDRVKGFIGRLIAKSGEQMTLKLNAALDASVEAEKPAQKPNPKGKGKKKGGRRGRSA
jgi:hypothetical protein